MESLASATEVIVVRVRADHSLRQWERLRQEEPVPVAKSERHICPAECLARWDNIQHGKFAHSFGMVECQAVSTTPTAVMSCHRKPLVAKMAHQRDLVLCHDTLGIWHMVRRAFRLTALAIAAQIWGDHVKVLRQPRGERV